MLKIQKNKIVCDFTRLPKYANGNIDWMNSIGYKIPFVYKNINGEIRIIDYGFENKKIKIEYKNNFHILFNSSFKQGRFINFISEIENLEILRSNIYDKLYITDPWIEEYFQEKDKHYFYTLSKGSGMKFNFICPYCKTIKHNKIPIYQAIIYHGISCPICGDNFSYPNKFAYRLFYTLEQEHIIDNYYNEYSPSWAKPYRYDNYFEYKDKKYIIEMDGELGHGNRVFGNKNIKDTVGIQIDIKKDNLAKEHGIKIIRIDATTSDFYYLKERCCESIPCVYENNQLVDWDYIETSCRKSIYNEINNYYLETKESISQISNHFKLSIPTILYVLKTFKGLGLNDYTTFIDKYKNKYLTVIEMYNSNYTISQIENETGIQKQSIRKYLKRGTEKGDCNYIPSSNRKKVKVYKNEIYIKTYNSISDLSRKSDIELGLHLDISEISYVCSGKNKQAKGFTFSFVQDDGENNKCQII